jgi:hypothetical protein
MLMAKQLYELAKLIDNFGTGAGEKRYRKRRYFNNGDEDEDSLENLKEKYRILKTLLRSVADSGTNIFSILMNRVSLDSRVLRRKRLFVLVFVWRK